MNFESILGNFALILFILTVVTGIIWFLDVFYLAKQRRAKAEAALAEFDARIAKLTADGIKPDQNGRTKLEADLTRQPTWIEYSGSFFPVIAAVFFLRSFLYEPFKIPSTSMLPTLEVGDFILVNKFTYGIRLPVINKKIIEMNQPQRGDVMVFKYPENPAKDYIKRVVGVPGDKITYKNKRLTVNGKELPYESLSDYLMPPEPGDDERAGASQQLRYVKQASEDLTGVKHQIVVMEERPTISAGQVRSFPNKDACSYNFEGFSCTVPAGNYFMMGDNRDNSDDSRYWGFVPDQNIVGKAFFVWMNFGNFGRIGSFK